MTPKHHCQVCKHPLFKHSIHLPEMKHPWSKVPRGQWGCSEEGCECVDYEPFPQEASIIGLEVELLELLDNLEQQSSTTD